MEFLVYVRSHHFKVTQCSHEADKYVNEFAKTLIRWSLEKRGGRFTKIATHVFASSVFDRSEYRFHINSLGAFLNFMRDKHFDEKKYVIVQDAVPACPDVEHTIREGWVPKENQLPAIEYVTGEVPPRSKLLAMQTGQGKSFVSMISAAKLKTRVVHLLRPMYMDKWLIDLEKTYDHSADDFVFVRGSDQLQALFMIAEAGQLTAKHIVISNKTFQTWIKLYEQYGDGLLEMGWPCVPENFLEFLGARLRQNDEAHLDLHLNFKIDLYTNTERSLLMSATFFHEDPFIRRMQELMVPLKDRYDPGVYNKYILVISAMYRFNEPERIQTKEFGSSKYSHHAVERSIMAKPKVQENYFSFLDHLMHVHFFSIKGEGQKVLVLSASVEMCTRLTEWFKKKYPEKDVRRYVGTMGDPYENLLDPEIRFATVGAAGAAHDVPLLRTTIMQVAMRSGQSNVQALGRTRPLPDGSTPRFVFPTCQDIPKQLEYHTSRLDIMRNKVRDIDITNYHEFV